MSASIARNYANHKVKGIFADEEQKKQSQEQLYADIGDFLFAHDLDLTPTNFSVALDYLTGANIGVEKAIRAVMMERGKITNGWIEALAAEQRADDRHDNLVG